MLLSVVIPCYNEEDNVELFYDTIVHVFGNLMKDTELIFVNDGSRDETFRRLENIYKNSPYQIKVISFSRNFGKEAALLAGLQHSEGDLVSIIDADLQQRPEYILEMMSILNEHPEYDSVAAYQEERKEGRILSFFKNCFYRIINKMTEMEMVRSASDFRLLKRKVVDAICSMPEKCRFSKGIFSWVGFNTFYMPYQVEERANGVSKWSFWKLFVYAIDGIVAFSTVPLTVVSLAGILLCVLSGLFMVIIVVKTLIWGDPVAGFPTLASLVLFTSGIQLLCTGVIGHYLAKNYIETKDRPVYIVKDFLKK